MPQGADENWLKVKTSKLPKARENAGIYATPKQSQMTFDAHLKISLY